MSVCEKNYHFVYPTPFKLTCIQNPFFLLSEPIFNLCFHRMEPGWEAVPDCCSGGDVRIVCGGKMGTKTH